MLAISSFEPVPDSVGCAGPELLEQRSAPQDYEHHIETLRPVANPVFSIQGSESPKLSCEGSQLSLL